MSEIAKCPICGEEPDILIDLFDKHEKYPKGYDCCEVQCRTLTTWNQYAAAMELAKAEVVTANATCGVPLDRLEARIEANRRLLSEAKMRVLEVFGE